MRHKASLLSLLACTLSGPLAAQTAGIEGPAVLKINETATYTTAAPEGVTAMRWLPPTGCHIISGQGTERITLTATFLGQDSPLRLVRTHSDASTDTLSLAVTMFRPVAEVVNHTIAPGETIEIGGIERTEADIYYTPAAKSKTGEEQVIAHRLTLEPKTGTYADMTKPYLQTASDKDIWVSWKTSYANEPVIRYGTSPDRLDQTVKGTSDDLSEGNLPYFWQSVHLTGLQPETTYYYQAVSGDRQSEVYHFRTLPSAQTARHMRILLMGDHQIKSRSGYEWLMKAASRKIEEKYGPLTDNIQMIMNIGDQVDVGTLDQYEQIHLFKSQQMSPYLPIMTAVGNHETYSDPGMAHYAAHYHYEGLYYKGIKSGTENYYAYQAGRILFVVLSTEHTGDAQKQWVRRVVDAAKNDDTVDFIISVNHRPIQAEQYIGDISAWARNEIMPILSETPKHVLNYGGHHHLYHRGQLTDYPLYHIINGAASWDQLWGMSSERDYDDVQKTIDYWGYQIADFDFDKKEMKVETYAIGNRDIVVDNILIDSFSRTLGQAAPDKPAIEAVGSEPVTLPLTLKGSAYKTSTQSPLNTTQYQFSTSPDFSSIALSVVRDVEDFYGSTHAPLHIPIDLNEGTDITQLTIGQNKLKNGTYYVRLRYRDANVEWSDWSDPQTFTVTGSIAGDPAIAMTDKTVDPGKQFSIAYEYAPVGQNAWVGIYRKGENPGKVQSYKWSYTPEATGSLNFTIKEAGEYYAVLFEDEGYKEISRRIPFYVGPIPQLAIDKTEYAPGEGIRITFSNGPALKDDWIGIYKRGETPGDGVALSDDWDYVSTPEGTLTLGAKLPKGYYFLNYFTRGGYFEPRERLYFSIGEKISTVTTDKTSFGPEEDIVVRYADGPGTPKDWVGVYREGKDPNVDELDGFYYTYGATEGVITIKGGSLAPGDYFSALFINDSYDEVSERIHFTVGGAVTGINPTGSDDALKLSAGADGTISLTGNTYGRLDIISASGGLLRTLRLKSGTTHISIADLPGGVYLLRFADKAGRTVTHKVIKR